MTFWAAGAAIVGSVISANGAQDAADTQAGAAHDATAAQERMFNRQIQLQEPWRQAGAQGLNRLGYLLGTDLGSNEGDAYKQVVTRQLIPQFRTKQITPGAWEIDKAGLDAAVNKEMQANGFGSLLRNFTANDFQKDPGYEFRLGEGQKALQRAASAMGGAGSGKYMKDAMAYNQGFASNEYQNAYSRFNSDNTNKFNRLASLAGIGQTSANAMGNAASNFGSQIGSNIIGAGNAAAAGQVGAANAINGGISQGISMYQQGQLMNKLFPGGGYINPAGVPASPSGFGGGGMMDELRGYGVF